MAPSAARPNAEARRAPPPAPESLDAAQRSRRQRIVSTAVDLLVTKPYDAVQMKDVSAAAGVALGTMYRYFSSKDHLFAEALLTWSEAYDASRMARELPADPVDRCSLVFRRAARAFQRFPPVYGHLLAVQASSDPTARVAYDRFTGRQADTFRLLLPGLDPDRAAGTVEVMGAVLDAGLREWARERMSMSEVYARIDRAAQLLLGE